MSRNLPNCRLSGPSRLIKSAACVVLALASLIFSTSTPVAQGQTAAKVHRKVLVMFDPEYPTILKNSRFEGQVRLDATVQANGNVSKVEVKGGNPMLAQYASQAVMKWKYAPGPAQTVEAVVFNFTSTDR
jgi:TonB family protein